MERPDLAQFLPDFIKTGSIDTNFIPALAKDLDKMRQIEAIIADIPTHHYLINADSRTALADLDERVDLVVTSPPYWNLKEYNDSEGQMGHIDDYESFLTELDKIWQRCFDLLTPGGRLICVVGDVCLSRRENAGEHVVYPLHASIQEHCRRIGYSNLTPIFWHKIANANYEVAGNSRFLGKPYEPNGIIKNDTEFILMFRKPGGYRKPTVAERILSTIPDENHKEWFQQIWYGITGASTKKHPAPYPAELTNRLIRMFSFVGDTVLDPFMGSGTTNYSAALWGRNSIGIEIAAPYFAMAEKRIMTLQNQLFTRINIRRAA